ncbi:D-lactate dehydrogenase [Salmonella enterica subsp. enterica]|uniref:D-lactate dehydrogenase n=1 Tax=Salmonella enterica I TaxID=59201 RepID=A0A447N7Q4_SALET|nr:D-lactate dehydrogenase [Salmonella enterica subsp. enterica]
MNFLNPLRAVFFTCTPEEGSKAFLHRFAAAGAAIRYQAVHADEVEDILALDIALRRNDTDWFEHLPPEIDSQLVHKLYYGHFMCHVFHQDYIVKKGVRRPRAESANAGAVARRAGHNTRRSTTLDICIKRRKR